MCGECCQKSELRSVGRRFNWCRMRDPCWHEAHSTHSKPHWTPLTPIRISQLASLNFDIPDPRLWTKLHACSQKCTLIKRADCTHKTHPRLYKHDYLLHTLFTLANVNCVLHFVSWIAGVRSLKERLRINSAAVKEKKISCLLTSTL